MREGRHWSLVLSVNVVRSGHWAYISLIPRILVPRPGGRQRGLVGRRLRRWLLRLRRVYKLFLPRLRWINMFLLLLLLLLTYLLSFS